MPLKHTKSIPYSHPRFHASYGASLNKVYEGRLLCCQTAVGIIWSKTLALSCNAIETSLLDHVHRSEAVN